MAKVVLRTSGIDGLHRWRAQHYGPVDAQPCRLERLQIPLPSKQFRLSVLEVIGALDDKIAGNSSLIRLTDELLSRTLFLDS